MIIQSRELPPIGTNAYALIDEARNECVIVDAPLGAYEWSVEVAKQHDCKITALILTHGHWDHMLDGHAFVDAGIPTFGHIADKLFYDSPGVMASYSIPGLEMKPVVITTWLNEQTELNLLGRSMEIRHVPGHCPGNILIYLPNEKIAVVGDVIFAGSVGRYDLPGGDPGILRQSIKNQIYTLPDDTVIYPGHGPETSVQAEKRGNPFMRG